MRGNLHQQPLYISHGGGYSFPQTENTHATKKLAKAPWKTKTHGKGALVELETLTTTAQDR